jgi:hypothetical protein
MPGLGGNVIKGGTVMPGSKPRVTMVEAVPTDANVGGGYSTPANGELAENVVTGYVYERQVGVWTRIDV